MSQVTYGAPSAQVQGDFVAPENSLNSKTKLSVEPIPAGLHMCTIFGVIALGTHMESYNNSQPEPKNKLMIVFEFPQFKRRFYEEDQEMKSSSIMQEMLFFAKSDKSKLRKIIEAVCQRKLSDDEAHTFDCRKLIGTSLVVNVQHYRKKNGDLGEKIESYNSTVGIPVPMGYQPVNEPWLFYLDPAFNNFRTELFAKLPQFLKKKLIESQEGQTYISRGGIFAKLEQENQNQQQTQTAYQQPTQTTTQQVNSGQRVQMLVNDFTYQSYISHGWTDESLVQHGKAKWIQQAPPAYNSNPEPGPGAPPAAQSYSQPVNTQYANHAQPVQNVNQVQNQGLNQPAANTFPSAANTPSAAPIQQAPQTSNFTAGQSTVSEAWLNEEDDDMPF